MESTSGTVLFHEAAHIQLQPRPPAHANVEVKVPLSSTQAPPSPHVFHIDSNMPDPALPDDTDPQASPAALSQLCDQCQVLSFDDSWFGWEEGGVFKPGPREMLRLKYDRCDSLPDLPHLKASAADGCAFCAALHDATLGLRLDGTADVAYKLAYSGVHETDEEGLRDVGLYLLIVTVSVTPTHDNGYLSTARDIIFSVDSDSKQ